MSAALVLFCGACQAWGAAPATEASFRATGEKAESELRFPDAVAAYAACVEQDADRDRRFCGTRLSVLRPQVADEYTGWTVLSDVRKHRASLSDTEAVTRIQSAVLANPTGPAAQPLRAWLAEFALSHGETPITSELDATAAASVAERQAGRDRASRHERIGIGGACVATVAWGTSLRSRAPLAVAGAALSGVVLGLVPAVLAWAYSGELAVPFARSAAVVVVATLLAPRMSPLVAFFGVVGGFVANAAYSGWLVSLGVP